MTFRFEIIHESKKTRARVGRIHTPHGIIDTPNFVAVGTNGTIKALDSERVDELGLQLMFCNTYHLILQPGPDTIRQAGGIHRFINRKQPIITDSGGFQVFSLAYGSVADELKSRGTKKQDGHVLKINEEGVLFRSYRDGSKLLLTPESSIAAQKAIGADIIIPLDELPPTHIDTRALKDSFDRTHRWEKRSLEEHLRSPNGQAIYAVIHGGIDPALRRESCRILSALPFDGFAIGGSVGKNRAEMLAMLHETMPHLPTHKPNHLLGIGDLTSLKAARHGLLLTQQGGIKAEKKENATLFTPIEPDCSCWTCQRYTLAYLHHLFKARETTAGILATIHNIHFMVQLMRQTRETILAE